MTPAVVAPAQHRLVDRRKERAAELFLLATRSNLWATALRMCDLNAQLDALEEQDRSVAA